MCFWFLTRNSKKIKKIEEDIELLHNTVYIIKRLIVDVNNSESLSPPSSSSNDCIDLEIGLLKN